MASSTQSQSQSQSQSSGIANLNPDQISQALAKLDPSKLAKVRAAIGKAGIDLSPNKFLVNRDGSITLTVTLPSEIATPMIAWAEAAQENPHEFCMKTIIDATTSYVLADWGAAG